MKKHIGRNHKKVLRDFATLAESMGYIVKIPSQKHGDGNIQLCHRSPSGQSDVVTIDIRTGEAKGQGTNNGNQIKPAEDHVRAFEKKDGTWVAVASTELVRDVLRCYSGACETYDEDGNVTGIRKLRGRPSSQHSPITDPMLVTNYSHFKHMTGVPWKLLPGKIFLEYRKSRRDKTILAFMEDKRQIYSNLTKKLHKMNLDVYKEFRIW